MALDTHILALVVSIAADIKRLFSNKQEALGFTPYDSTNPSNYITDTSALKAIEDAKVSVFSAVISKFSSLTTSVTIGQPIGGTTAVWKSGQLILDTTTGDLYKVQTDGTVVLFRILPSESTMLVSVLYGVNKNLGPITLLYTKVAGDVISTLFNPVHAGNVYYRDSGADSNVDTKLAMIGNSANLQTSIKYSLVGAINELFDNKQNKLVSGDSLKTVGGQDLLGSGNIELTSDNITNSLGYTPINILEIGAPNGITPLGADSKIPALYLPSYVDDVLEFINYETLPEIGESGKIYITIDNDAQFRWSGSVYIELVSSPGSTDAIAEGSVNLYFTVTRVLNSVLTGLSLASSLAVTATDNILSAIGKLQKQLNNQEVWKNAINDALTSVANLVNSKVDTNTKDASDGFPGLTGFKLNLQNTANTFTSWFTTAATAARTWAMPDKDGTVALLSDITGTNSGTNTGDQNLAPYMQKTLTYVGSINDNMPPGLYQLVPEMLDLPPGFSYGQLLVSSYSSGSITQILMGHGIMSGRTLTRGKPMVETIWPAWTELATVDEINKRAPKVLKTPRIGDSQIGTGWTIQTSINYNTSIDFLLTITGNLYQDKYPVNAQVQGYIYQNSVICSKGISTNDAVYSVIFYNDNGKLGIYIPSIGYFAGLEIMISSTSSDQNLATGAQSGASGPVAGSTNPQPTPILALATRSSNTFTGPQQFLGNSLFSPVLNNTGEARGVATITSGSLVLDLNHGVVSVNLNQNITSLSLLHNFSSSIVCQSVAIETIGDGVQRSIVWPNGNGTTTLLVKLVGGIAPTPTKDLGKIDRYHLISVSQFLWHLTIGGQNL